MNNKNNSDEDNNEMTKDYGIEIESEDRLSDNKELLRTSDGKYHHLKNDGNTPTQTYGLITTVPQNIANLKIGGKHVPTRNSLRHSRMIVMSKTEKIPIEFSPPIVIYHDRARIIMWIILTVGILMSFECSSLQIYAPNSKSQLNPFYTTVPILFSGIFGFIYLRCCRKEYPGLQRNACEKSIKILSVTTSIMAIMTSIIYIFNISIHLISFLFLNCQPPDLLTETCLCKLENNEMIDSIFNNSWDYADLTCFEVYYIFNVILGFNSIICLILVILNIYYLNLHWSSRSLLKSTKNYDYNTCNYE